MKTESDRSSMRVFNDILDPELIKLIKNGAVGVLPTDTVYGLVCVAANETAAVRESALKGREHRPGTLIAANIRQLTELGIKTRYVKAVEHFWPGAVSVRIPHHPVNHLVDAPTGTIAVRIPDDPTLLQMLESTGPLLTTSANSAGEPVATVLAEAQKYFGETVDFYVDGGDLSGRPASTIIQIVDDAIEVVREGAVKIDESGRIVSQ